MSKLSDNRRENLRRLIKEADGPAALASKLGYSNASFLVQMAGPNPSRDVTEKTARAYEAKLGLPEGCLDETPGPEIAPAKARTQPAAGRTSEPGPQAGADVSGVLEVIRLVGNVLDAEHVALPQARLEDFIKMVYNDAVEHDGAVREEFVRNLVRLVK